MCGFDARCSYAEIPFENRDSFLHVQPWVESMVQNTSETAFAKKLVLGVRMHLNVWEFVGTIRIERYLVLVIMTTKNCLLLASFPVS